MTAMNSELLEKLMCIRCGSAHIEEREDNLICQGCGDAFPVHNGIPHFLVEHLLRQTGWNEDACKPNSYEDEIARANPCRFRKIDEPLLQHVNGDVLEIGCGTCRLGPSVEKRGARFFGIDPLRPFLRYAQKKRGLCRLVWGQGERLPFRDGSFDCIISGYYSYRYVNPELGLPEARRVLKRGGTFAFGLINHWILKLLEFAGRMTAIRKPPQSFTFKPLPSLFEFVSLSGLRSKSEQAGFFVENVISTPIVPFFQGLTDSLSNHYYRGGRTVYLGNDVIVFLKAI